MVTVGVIDGTCLGRNLESRCDGVKWEKIASDMDGRMLGQTGAMCDRKVSVT